MFLSRGRAAAQTSWLLEVITEGRTPSVDDVAERLSAALLAERGPQEWCDVLDTVGRSMARAHIRVVEVEHDHLVRVVLATLDGPLVRLSCRVELATGRLSAFGLGRPFRAITWSDELIATLAGDLRLRVRDHGGDGPGIVLLHCGLADVSHWDRAARELPGRRIAIDLRAHGQWPAGTPFRVSDIAADIATAMRTLEVEPATIVGHSLGGLVAVTCAARHGVGSRLVTLDGPYALDRNASAGTPSPPDAPEWLAVENAPEPFATRDDIEAVDVPWLAVLCDVRDAKSALRPPLADLLVTKTACRVLWESARHDTLIDSPRAMQAVGNFALDAGR